MIGKDIKVGMCFRRKNGTTVEITDEKTSEGMRDLQMTPLTGKGRRTWKWDYDIARDLIYVGNDSSIFTGTD